MPTSFTFHPCKHLLLLFLFYLHLCPSLYPPVPGEAEGCRTDVFPFSSPPHRWADQAELDTPAPASSPPPRAALRSASNSHPVPADSIKGRTEPLKWKKSFLVRKAAKDEKENQLMEQTGSIYSVTPHASLTITCCSAIQVCFPRTNIILIYNATKDKAAFLILISDSVIISSIKNHHVFQITLSCFILAWNREVTDKCLCALSHFIYFLIYKTQRPARGTLQRCLRTSERRIELCGLDWQRCTTDPRLRGASPFIR